MASLAGRRNLDFAPAPDDLGFQQLAQRRGRSLVKTEHAGGYTRGCELRREV